MSPSFFSGCHQRWHFLIFFRLIAFPMMNHVSINANNILSTNMWSVTSSPVSSSTKLKRRQHPLPRAPRLVHPLPQHVSAGICWPRPCQKCYQTVYPELLRQLRFSLKVCRLAKVTQSALHSAHPYRRHLLKLQAANSNTQPPLFLVSSPPFALTQTRFLAFIPSISSKFSVNENWGLCRLAFSCYFHLGPTCRKRFCHWPRLLPHSQQNCEQYY